MANHVEVHRLSIKIQVTISTNDDPSLESVLSQWGDAFEHYTLSGIFSTELHEGGQYPAVLLWMPPEVAQAISAKSDEDFKLTVITASAIGRCDFAGWLDPRVTPDELVVLLYATPDLAAIDLKMLQAYPPLQGSTIACATVHILEVYTD